MPSAALGNAAEAALIALAMARDEAAFNELVRRRQSWLRNLLRRLCRDQTLADDLAQQTFLQVWRALPTLKSSAAFASWVRKLAVNSWLQHVRAAKPLLPLDAAEAHPDAARVSSVQQQLDLDGALAQLPADVRLCVVLAYNEGMSHSEISRATALPLGTVKSHISRGAQRLRALLHAYAPAEGRHHVR